MTLTRYLTLLLFNPISLWVTRRRVRQRKRISGDPMPVSAFLGMSIMPTVLTMALAGVWHGAGLQFLVWGLLHAVYLSVNHLWRGYGPRPPTTPRPFPLTVLVTVGQIGLTYFCVLIGLVFFRSASVHDAVSLLSAMAGLHGFEAKYMTPAAIVRLGGLGRKLLSWGLLTTNIPDIRPKLQPAELLVRYFIIFLMPNTQQIMSWFSPYLAKVDPPRLRFLTWRPQMIWAVAIGVLLVFDMLALNYSPPFLYFQF